MHVALNSTPHRPLNLLRIVAVLIAIAVGAVAPVQGAISIYDWYGADTTIGGAGTWDAASTYWKLNGVNVAWPNAAATEAWAAFGGTGGYTVTIANNTTINANGLWFHSNATIARANTGASLNFVGTTPTLKIDSGITATTTTGLSGSSVLLTGGGTWLSGASNRISDSMAITVDGGSTFSLGANSDTVGTITLVNGTMSSGTLTTNGTYELQSGTVGAVLAGAGRILNKTGSGTVTLSGANTYTGATNIAAGTLQLSASNRIANTSAVNLTGGTLALGGNSDTVASVTLSNNSSLTGTGTLTAVNLFDMQSGTVTARLGGTSSLNKTTAGTVTLAGANTYTGGTNINAGTLNLTGSLANSAINLASGATLTGSGTAAGSLVVNGALSPGNVGIGTLTTGAQIWNGGGSLKWEINSATGTAGTAWDQLKDTGTLSINASSGSKFLIQIVGLNGLGNPGAIANFNNTQAYSWSLLTAAGAINNFSANSFQLDGSQFALYNSLAGGSFSIAQVAGGLNLVFTPIPEPRVYALLFGACTLGFVGYRRWRNHSSVTGLRA